uniref:Uncharacterized protein n=1 Tax=Brassica oleracea TaxID=3712 RepID=A0A3P6EHI8_BRAOL|nr:unnamed protein product [Brassica oleracea]
MVSSSIDEARNQKAAYRAIANRLDQAKHELAEHQANARERNQPTPDPLRETLKPHNAGAFSTPEILSARSGRYTGDNSQRPPQQNMPQQSLSYSGLDEIDTGLQAQRSTLIQSQNKYMERTGEPRNRIPPLGNLTSENQTPSALRTAQKMRFSDPIRQARGYDPRKPIDMDPQREDLEIPGETGTFQNYIERNDAELKRIHAIVYMATSSSPDIDMVIEGTRRAYINKFREIKAKISHPNEVVALTALKNGVWFSSKFREKMAVQAPISLDDALHRTSYFATHEEEVAALKEQYIANKNNIAKKNNAPKEPATKGQHSYAINNSPQNKPSTYDPSKHCAFHG